MKNTTFAMLAGLFLGCLMVASANARLNKEDRTAIMTALKNNIAKRKCGMFIWEYCDPGLHKTDEVAKRTEDEVAKRTEDELAKRTEDELTKRTEDELAKGTEDEVAKRDSILIKALQDIAKRAFCPGFPNCPPNWG